MSSRKSKKRIGSTRQRNLGHKAEERDANEELTETITETPDEASNAGKTGVLQELSTVHHVQPLYSGEVPKCQLDVVSENIEGDQHDPGKTSTEKLETGAPAELCEAETSTSGKIRRMGSTRRTKQAFKAEERKEEEEKDNNSMQIIQEEFNITRTEDQYLKEEPHAPESDQAHTHLLELGVSEVKGLTERPRDESPGEERRLLSELDVKTEAQYTHSPPQSFDQCPTPAVNPPFCVTSPQEEGESLLKQSCFNLSEAKEISSTDTTQDTPEGLDGHYQQREDQSPEDVRESDEQRRTEEVVLEVSLNIGDISVKEHIKHHVLHRKESQEGMPIMKVDNKPLREMEVESAGIQNFSLQMQAMPQGSTAPTTAENISEIKDNLQIFQPANTNTDGTVTEGYDKYGNQNSLQTEQTISIKVSQEKDTNSELNVQRPKKRMGSTRRIVKGNKMIEDIGNSQEETHEMREDTLLNPELTEEDTKFRLKTVVNDKLDMVFTVNERGAQLEEAGCEFEEQENKHGNLILDENTEGTLIAMDAEAFHSTENITGDSGTMTSTSSRQLVMEGNLDHHHNEIGRKGVTEIAELNAPRLRERLGSTHEPLQGEKEVKREYGCDLTGKEIDSKDIDFQMIPGTDILAIVKSGKLQVEDIGTESFTDKPTVGSVCESFSPFENDFLASPPMVDHREEMVDNSLNLQGESFDCTKTCMSDKDAVEKAEYFTNQSEVRIPSDTFSSFEVAEHFKGAFVREDVDQLQKHDEGKAENSPESPEDQERKNSTNMAVSEQPEIENQLSCPSEDPCENCAGTSAEVIGAIENTNILLPQSEVEILSESFDPLEQNRWSSSTPDHIPEITVASLDVHTESSSLETYNPEIEHCDEVEQGTQAHILSSTMDPEVPNNGAEASELVQDGWTQQSDHCESSLRLQHHEKEGSLKQSASRQKRKMGSTRRQKRETNEVNLDEETKSSHETGEMTETEIEVQQEENIQSEQISSREKIHSAGVNTIPMSIGQIEISESSGSTAAEETSYSQLSHEDSQKEPKSMLQKRKMGSSRRGQGLGNRGKGEAEQVDEHMDDTSRQESGGALLQNEGTSKESCSGLLKNTQDLPVEGEQLLASVQSSESHLQPLAQAERPDELIDERVPPASAQSKPSVLSVSSSPSSEFQEHGPNKDPQTSTKKRKMGSTRKNMRRQGEEDKSDLKAVHGSTQRWNDDTVWDSTISDVEDLPTGPTETATIQKMTETQGQEDTLPHDESAGHGSAGQKKSPQRTRRKMGSRHGGQGYRGIGGLEESEDQPVCKRQEKDGSILQGTQENVHSEGVDEQGLSKLTFTGDEESQKVKQPNPSGARSKLDLERKYGPGDTLTSLEEAVMFNIVMVGESSVGKTSFIHQFQNGQFFDDHSATIGVDTCIQTLAVDGELVKLQIWDTAGQERFHSLTRQVLHKADGLIVMYDISSSQTFCAVRKWISCIEEGARSEVLIMLLGNKNDSEERQVLHPEGERLAQEHNFHFMECSAATGHNVPQAMEALARLLKQTVKESDEEHVTLHKKPQQKKSGCC
ncbi:uncharacterized protein LOC105889174 isoform X3 [Clupea harengus]|uniref:Uncharacterized protein LOC105889174 isoform X3 n=1 Tax=Clupea harengus TaxID=7950 RepID=A0A8M1K9K0_CLUHA|nr:uncharacterized protein LOC105889174 isoform X3 [Clupea harengus]